MAPRWPAARPDGDTAHTAPRRAPAREYRGPFEGTLWIYGTYNTSWSPRLRRRALKTSRRRGVGRSCPTAGMGLRWLAHATRHVHERDAVPTARAARHHAATLVQALDELEA